MNLDSETSNKFANLSFLAACLVVFIHAPFECSTGMLNELAMKLGRFGLCGFAVPFFFFASGFFLIGKYSEGNPCGDVYVVSIRKRITTLLVPFLIFNTIAFLAKHLVAKDWATLTLMEVISQYGLNPFCHPVYHLLWYVICLFTFVLISPILVFVISKSRRLACVLCVVLLGANLCKVVASDRMWINKDFEFVLEHMFNVVGLFFFALGMFVRKWISVVPGGLRTGVCFIVLGVACRYVFIGRPMAAVLSSLCMIYGFFILVPGDAWPKQLVRNSFALYLLHGLLLFAYRVATPSVSPAGACAWFFVAISTIILGLFIIEALRKLMPRMIEIAFGGR